MRLRHHSRPSQRNNWLGVPVSQDPFANQMLLGGVPMRSIKDWSVDPQINLDDSKLGSVFDALEDTDAAACLSMLTELSKLNMPPPSNSAFVFIKPHAVTEKVKIIAKAGLEAHGITILEEGCIKAEKIDKHKLIDQHYYAIASKATILKPEQLNVPEDKFQAQFGLSGRMPWPPAKSSMPWMVVRT